MKTTTTPAASRKPLFKRAMFQLHLWGGLALGVYAFLIGLTGSVLVFREEIVERMSPVPAVAAPAAAPDLDEIRAGVQAHYPGWHPWSLEAPAEAGRPWGSYLLRTGGGKMVFADATGTVVGEMNVKGTWLELFEQFHSFLLIPGGRFYNGVAGLILVALALTGAVLWWPARGEWHKAFRIVRRSNWKGLVFDLHRVGGALMFGFVVLFSVTGGYFTWPAAYKSIAAAILPSQPKPVAPAVQADGPRLPVADLVASAQQAMPGTFLVRVLTPRAESQPVTVVLAHGQTADDRRYSTSQLTLHPQTGEVLTVDDYRRRRAADSVIAWIGPMHTGHFGGLGVKIVWALAGLALPALFVTGFLMWCNRVVAPRLKRAGA